MCYDRSRYREYTVTETIAFNKIVVLEQSKNSKIIYAKTHTEKGRVRGTSITHGDF